MPLGCSFLSADDGKGVGYRRGRVERSILRPGHISIPWDEGQPLLHLSASQASSLIEICDYLKPCSGLGKTVAFSGLLFLFLLTASLGPCQTLAENEAFSAVVLANMAFTN